jgi:hypothetical protein
MDMRELVSAIVQEVLEKMRGEQTPCVLVLCQRDEALAAQIQDRLEEKAEVLFLTEDLGGRTPVRHILPCLSCSDMSDLARGNASHALMETVLNLLLRGNTVEVLNFAYKAHQGSAPTPLYALYESFEKTLTSFGLKAFSPKAAPSLPFRGHVLTEQDVRLAHAQAIPLLLIPAKTIVTPLARDCASKLHIAIKHC